MLIVLIIVVNMVSGDFFAILEFGRDHDKLQMANMQFELTERSSFWAAAGFGLFMYLPGYTASQITVQRYLSLENLDQARRSLLINAAIAPVVSLIFFLVGTALFVFYSQQGGFPDIPNQDQLLPYFLAAEMPVAGLTGLLMAGLFAAGMSTIDSGINSMTAVIVKDWLPERDKKPGVGISRIITIVLGLLIVITSLLVPYIGEHVIDMISKIAGTFLGLLLGIYLLGMFTRRANAGGALIGLAAGGLSLAIVWTQTEVPHWYYGLFTIGVTLVAGWIASRYFQYPAIEQLEGYFYNSKAL